MKRFAAFLASLAVLFGVGLALAPAAVAYDPLEELCKEPKAATSATCKDRSTDPKKNPLTGSDGIIMKVTVVISVIAGVVAVVMVIFGGAGMITSGGDANKFKESRNRVTHSLIGLVIIVSAQAIISFIVINVL